MIFYPSKKTSMKKKLVISFILILLLGIILIIFCNKENSNNPLKPHFPSSDKDYYQSDSLTGHFHKPNVVREFEWAEHPEGKIIMKTNNIGLRNDSDIKTEKAKNTLRVLVTGDSHTDGVLNNNESVAYFLEQGLYELYPSQKNEVLNAGNGYFGPQNYLGVYHKFKPFNPDVFVAIIYTGNDFLDAIRIEVENGRLNVPERPKDYYDNLWEIDEIYSGFTGQYLNQLKFFDTFPNYIDTALVITQQNLGKINTLCRKNNTLLLVVLLPSKIDTEPQTDKDRIDEVFQIMKFNTSHLQKNRQIVGSLITWLEKHHIPYIDLEETFKSSGRELFWKADYHINIDGHLLTAKELLNSGITN